MPYGANYFLQKFKDTEKKFLQSKWLMEARVDIVHHQCRWKWKKRLTFNMQHLLRAFTPNIQLQKKKIINFLALLSAERKSNSQCAMRTCSASLERNTASTTVHNARLRLMTIITEINELAIFAAKVTFQWGADAGVNPQSHGQGRQLSCIWAT